MTPCVDGIGPANDQCWPPSEVERRLLLLAFSVQPWLLSMKNTSYACAGSDGPGRHEPPPSAVE